MAARARSAAAPPPGPARLTSTRPRMNRSHHPDAGTENPGGDTVAPEGQPQSDLFLQKVHEVLNDPASAKDLEQATNLTREQIEQFVTKFSKIKSAPAGPGRDINVKPGEQTAVAPSADLPGLDPKTRISSKNQRTQGTMAHDEVHGNLEDIRFQPPKELRGKWEAFKNRLSKVPAPKRVPNPGPKTGQ